MNVLCTFSIDHVYPPSRAVLEFVQSEKSKLENYLNNFIVKGVSLIPAEKLIWSALQQYESF